MQDLHALFHPRSVALVGVPRSFKVGSLFLMGLIDQGYPGGIYPVNPSAETIDGLRAFPDLMAIPHPVDTVIVMTPKAQVFPVLEACGRKGVRNVILYTSGFGESGDDAGLAEQQRVLDLARAGGFRLLGPNCMGVYAPGSGLAFFPQMPRQVGHVGFASQSGSLGNLFVKACAARQVYFRYVVSYGNGCDVDLPELLHWMGRQPDTRLLCAYCEGVRDGRALVEACRTVVGRMPLVLWKVGRTEAGRRAAASHTGSLGGADPLWGALFRQQGILDVCDMEEMLDLVMAFEHLPLRGQGRTVIVSGPGGPAVSAADAAQRHGVPLADLAPRTLRRLRSILPGTGTSVANPVDVGLSASFALGLYLDTLDVLAEDPNVDALVVIGGGASDETNEAYLDGLVRVRGACGKDLLAVALPGFVAEERVLAPLCGAGIPVYPTAERALRAYGRVLGHARRAQNDHPRELTRP